MLMVDRWDYDELKRLGGVKLKDVVACKSKHAMYGKLGVGLRMEASNFARRDVDLEDFLDDRYIPYEALDRNSFEGWSFVAVQAEDELHAISIIREHMPKKSVRMRP